MPLKTRRMCSTRNRLSRLVGRKKTGPSKRSDGHVVLGDHEGRCRRAATRIQRPGGHHRDFLAGRLVDHFHVAVGIGEVDERVMERSRTRSRARPWSERARVEADPQRHDRGRGVAEHDRAQLGPRPRRVRLAVFFARFDEFVLESAAVPMAGSRAAAVDPGRQPQRSRKRRRAEKTTRGHSDLLYRRRGYSKDRRQKTCVSAPTAGPSARVPRPPERTFSARSASASRPSLR